MFGTFTNDQGELVTINFSFVKSFTTCPRGCRISFQDGSDLDIKEPYEEVLSFIEQYD